MSGIFFRVFENLISDENDPARFKLDIMVNNGSILHPDSIGEIENHCIPISLDDTYSKTLTLEDIDHFFYTLLNMQYQPENGSNQGSNQDEQEAKDEVISKSADVPTPEKEDSPGTTDNYMNEEDIIKNLQQRKE